MRSSTSTSTLKMPRISWRSRDALLTLGIDEPGKGKLGDVVEAVALAVRRRDADAGEGADIADEAVVVGPVVMGDRPRIRPGAEEELQEAVGEDVGEAREGRVAAVRPQIGLDGGVERQRALRPEEAEEARVELRDLPDAVSSNFDDVGGRKFDERVLPEIDDVLGDDRAVADARLLRRRALQLAQRREEIGAARAPP